MAVDTYIQPTVPDEAAVQCRLGAGQGTANQMTRLDQDKFVKLAASDRYDLCAAGDAIEGWIYAVEMAPQNGYSVGSVEQRGRQRVTFDGNQAAGTGAITFGQYVVCGAVTARGTKQDGPPKVRSATSQTPGAYNWRVVSLGTAGTGAIGTYGVIERI